MKYQCECEFVNKPCVIESDVNLDMAPSGNPPFICAFRFWGESHWVPLQTPPTADNVEGANLHPPTQQGQNGTAGKPQVWECTTSAIA